MSPLNWFKKEKPLRGLAGLGGGFAGRGPQGASFPSDPLSATGGTKTGPTGGYYYHKFTSPGTFAISQGSIPAPNSTVLLVGSGGAGASRHGGGGGAGGMINTGPGPNPHPAIAFAQASYTITTGAMPLAGFPDGSPPTQGNQPLAGQGVMGHDSVIEGDEVSVRAAGGGAGGNYGQFSGQPGGSGGGCGNGPYNTQSSGNQYGVGSPLTPGVTPTTQGNAGGYIVGSPGSGFAGAGGGGTGAVGANITNPGGVGGPGGNGTQVPWVESPNTFCGGGGGGGSNTSPGGEGGSGGGGDGGYGSSGNGENAIDYTGGGGGGHRNTPGSGPNCEGGVGGSGICIIRYPDSI